MKKLLITFLLFTIGIIASYSQVQWYRTTAYSHRYQTSSGYWTGWSDWEDSNMKMKIDLGNDIVVIYSPRVQTYKVIETMDPPYDSSGKQIKFKVIDQDGDIGFIRLRIQNTGRSQFYVDFSNVSWVYNVIRIQ